MLILATLLLCNCAAPLCELRSTAHAPLPRAGLQAFTTTQWMMVLLRGPNHTCTGQTIVPQHGVPEGMVERQHATHVYVSAKKPGAEHMVWLQTHSQGTRLFGPVALVVPTENGVVVRALGTLLGEPGNMQLYKAPTPWGEALWAHNSGCSWHKLLGRNLCFEVLQILPVANAAVASSLLSPSFDLMRQEAVALGDGWYQLKEERAQWVMNGQELVLQETLCRKEVSLRAHTAPRNKRQAQSRRVLVYAFDGGWSESAPALWHKF